MSGENEDTSADSSKLLAYLQLFRAPNVFTAIADVAMGFVFVTGSLQPVGGFLCLALASCLLYTAGMILNDVYDFDVDLKERPSRPLPLLPPPRWRRPPVRARRRPLSSPAPTTALA